MNKTISEKGYKVRKKNKTKKGNFLPKIIIENISLQ